MKPHSSFWNRIQGEVWAIAAILLASSVFVLGRDLFAKGQWALLYLLIVVLVASRSGVRAALVAALAGFLAWNYLFLPPYFSFIVHDPKDWLSLVVFLIVGSLIGLQTGRMRDREEAALARERETALFSRLSVNLVSTTSIPIMAEVLLSETREIIRARRASLFIALESGDLREYTRLAPSEPQDPLPASFAKEALQRGKENRLPDILTFEEHADLYLPLQTKTHLVGILHISNRLDGKPYTFKECHLLRSIANLAATFLERQDLEEAANQAEALREADRLKTTLISSVSHELKTPLAAMSATVTNLMEEDIEWTPDILRPEMEAINENLNRLHRSIASLLDLSRLEADAWEPKKEPYEFGELLSLAVKDFSRSEQDRLSFDFPDDLVLEVDCQQWVRLFYHLIENALVYSPGVVRIGGLNEGEKVRLWVEDVGPGLPSEEQEKIFKKFYRGTSAKSFHAGTGLGLAIAEEIARFHGGHIRVENVQPHGCRFVVTLPLKETINERV